MNIVLPNKLGSGLLLAMVGSVIQGCSGRERYTGACARFSRTGTWEVAMRSDAAAYALEGTIETSDRAVRVRLTGVSREGTREPLDYVADSLIVGRDSVHFRFAPLGIRMDGWSATRDSIAARFSFPQPPFGPIAGTGVIHRKR